MKALRRLHRHRLAMLLVSLLVLLLTVSGQYVAAAGKLGVRPPAKPGRFQPKSVGKPDPQQAKDKAELREKDGLSLLAERISRESKVENALFPIVFNWMERAAEGKSGTGAFDRLLDQNLGKFLDRRKLNEALTRWAKLPASTKRVLLPYQLRGTPNMRQIQRQIEALPKAGKLLLQEPRQTTMRRSTSRSRVIPYQAPSTRPRLAGSRPVIPGGTMFDRDSDRGYPRGRDITRIDLERVNRDIKVTVEFHGRIPQNLEFIMYLCNDEDGIFEYKVTATPTSYVIGRNRESERPQVISLHGAGTHRGTPEVSMMPVAGRLYTVYSFTVPWDEFGDGGDFLEFQFDSSGDLVPNEYIGRYSYRDRELRSWEESWPSIDEVNPIHLSSGERCIITGAGFGEEARVMLAPATTRSRGSNRDFHEARVQHCDYGSIEFTVDENLVSGDYDLKVVSGLKETDTHRVRVFTEKYTIKVKNLKCYDETNPETAAKVFNLSDEVIAVYTVTTGNLTWSKVTDELTGLDDGETRNWPASDQTIFGPSINTPVEPIGFVDIECTLFEIDDSDVRAAQELAAAIVDIAFDCLEIYARSQGAPVDLDEASESVSNLLGTLMQLLSDAYEIGYNELHFTPAQLYDMTQNRSKWTSDSYSWIFDGHKTKYGMTYEIVREARRH